MDEQMIEIVERFRNLTSDPLEVVMSALDQFVARGLIEVSEIEGWASEVESYLNRVAA